MTTIELASYQIHVGNIWGELENWLQAQSYSRYIILVDENTRAYCWPLLQQKVNLPNPQIIEIRSGEQHKNIHTCTYIWKQLMDEKADRNALFINLGGGVIGDMGGFCAATYKRGIDFIQIPTTLLAQVDSSIGGKLGIDFGDVKNSVGLFTNPQKVFISPEFLETLPEREIRSGLAEIVKHSLIADSELWQKLQSIHQLNAVDWASLLVPSLEVKKRVVESDPLEKSWRKTLNFGHTIGHALESWALATPQPLLHGEAVAAGMLCETYLSGTVSGLDRHEVEAISDFILRIYNKQRFDPASFPTLIELMKNDKKNQDGQINFTMLQAIGTPLINQSCTDQDIEQSLTYYLER